MTYWASNQGTSLDNDKEVLTPQLKKFEEETGIKVNLEVIGWNDLQTRIQTAVTSGQAPDVLNIGNTWAASLQSTGAFMPFDSAAFDAIGGKDKFVKTAMDTGGVPGEDPTSVPLYGLAYGLYYNKAMFKDAGLTPPTTWEEMVAAAKKLTTGDKHGFALAAGSYTENSHFAFINAAQNDAEFFDAEGKPTFTSDGVVNGISRYLDLMQTDKVVEPGQRPVRQRHQGRQRLCQRQGGHDAQPEQRQQLHRLPGHEGRRLRCCGLPRTLQAPRTWPPWWQASTCPSSRTPRTRTPHLAFVKFMTSEATQAALDKPFAALPVLAGVTPSFTDNAELAKTFSDIYENKSKPLPLVPAEDQFESTVGKAMNQMFATVASGGTVSKDDIKAALTTAQQAVEAARLIPRSSPRSGRKRPARGPSDPWAHQLFPPRAEGAGGPS